MDRPALPNENLFDNSTMTFGEHLDELRRSLARALVWLAIGCLVALIFFSKPIVRLIQEPLRAAIVQYHADRSLTQLGYDPLERSPEVDALRSWMLEHQMAWELVYVLPTEMLPVPAGAPILAEQDDTSSNTTETEDPTENGEDAVTPTSPAPESPAPESPAPESPAPESPAPESPAPESPAPESPAPESPAPETAAPETAAPETAAPESPASETAAPESPASETAAPESPAAEEEEASESEPVVDDASADEPPAAEAPLADAEPKLANEPLAMDELLERVPAPSEFVPQLQLKRTQAALNAHQVEEPFMIYIKASVVVGAVIASPMVFYYLWSFVAAGLYPHERKYVYMYLPFSVTLFIAGVCLAFFAVLRYVLEFLLNFNSALSVDLEPRLSYYISFVLLLPLGFGIAFQLPLVMLFLQRIGIFETAHYENSWRMAVLVIAFLSMILTPADPYSMVLLMVPMVALYFLGIGLCRFMPRGRGLGEAAYDPR